MNHDVMQEYVNKRLCSLCGDFDIDVFIWTPQEGVEYHDYVCMTCGHYTYEEIIVTIRNKPTC